VEATVISSPQSQRLALPALGLLGLSVVGLVGGPVRPVGGGAAWPSFAHPLGLDSIGRDFLGVLAGGTLDFALPGLAAVCVLLVAAAVQSWWTVSATPLGGRAEGARDGGGWLLLAAPPRLLLVMIGMLFLEEPSPWIAAGIVTALYLPVCLDECGAKLASLRSEQILAGAIAHGLSAPRLVFRHLLAGHLGAPLCRHGATLFAQVAFTQIALAYVFGASAVASGLSLSWGMEFRRLVARLPSRGGSFCSPDAVCAPDVALLQCTLLVLASLLLLGGLLRAAATLEPEGRR
jgi:peptide/nickel transport system permease protein